MQRLRDWPQRLARFIHGRRNKPFQRGVQDCCMFACDGIREITGTDLAAEVRGKYKTEEEAQALVSMLTEGKGLTEYFDILAQRFQIPEVPIKLAQPGDVVLMSGASSNALGIIAPDGRFAYFADTDGLARYPVLDCDRAWRIG